MTVGEGFRVLVTVKLLARSFERRSAAMAKLFITGVIEWVLIDPYAVVSVESGTGEGVQGLGPKNFTVGSLGSGSGVWKKHNVTDVAPIGGAGKGFYYLSLGLIDGLWQPHMCNVVFTIEVQKARSARAGAAVDRGQAIAINKCCDSYGYGGKLA